MDMELDLRTLLVGIFIGILVSNLPSLLQKAFFPCIIYLKSIISKRDKENKEQTNSPEPPILSSDLTVDKDYVPRHRYAAEHKKAISSLKEAVNVAEGWELFYTYSHGGVTLYKKEVDGSAMPCVKGVGTIECDPKNLHQFLKDHAIYKKRDPQMISIKQIERLDMYTNIEHQTYAGIWPVAGRDMLLLKCTEPQEDGTIWYGTVSVEHDDVPEEDPFVRGATLVGGTCIEPVPGNPHQSKLTFICLVDLKGTIPSMILAKVARDQPGMVHTIQKMCKHMNFTIQDSTDHSFSTTNETIILTEDERDEYHKQAITMQNDFLKVSQERNWVYTGLEKEVRLFIKSSDEHVTSCMGKGLIMYPPKQVFEFLSDPSSRFLYDNMLRTHESIATIDEYTSIQYMHHVARHCILRAARDFVMLSSKRLVDENVRKDTYVLVNHSIEEKRAPHKHHLVRGDIKTSGWLIEPSKDNPKHSIVSHVVCVDLKGHVPASLVDLMQRRQPLAVHYVRKLIEKKYGTH